MTGSTNVAPHAVLADMHVGSPFNGLTACARSRTQNAPRDISAYLRPREQGVVAERSGSDAIADELSELRAPYDVVQCLETTDAGSVEIRSACLVRKPSLLKIGNEIETVPVRSGSPA